jgi:LacI family repressor for deo operon, udp, cdd, tsx, nupC, and nupG
VYPYDMGNCRVPARPGEVRRLGRDPRRTAEGPGSAPGAPSTEHLLSVRDLPTAVLAHSDEMALGAMRTIRRAGLRVPEDVSVIGIDDHPLAELVDLTTVRQPVRDQGLQAAHLLLALLRGEKPNLAKKLPTRVVVRSTTATACEKQPSHAHPAPEATSH